LTIRAVLLGLLAALFIAGFGYYNDQVLGLESIVAGRLLPISVIGSLIAFVLLINPVIGLRKRWAFRPRELAVMVALMLAGCSIPARGLMESFTPALALPIHYNQIRPGWRSAELLTYTPERMLPNQGQYDETVVKGFLGGLARQDHSISLDQVPWSAWREPLMTFGPMILLLAVCVVCTALIVHRQWVHHERLRYPIAEVTGAMLDREPESRLPGIFCNKLFWWGLGIVLAIRLNNGLAEWFPQIMVRIPLTWKFGQVLDKWPFLAKSVWCRRLFVPTLYPAVIAFTYFLASDIALSFGLSHIILSPIALLLITYGVDMSNDYMAGGPEGWQRFGSYFAFTLILLYIGRRYYGEVLKKAVTFRGGRGLPAYAPWACRLLIIAAVGLTYWMIRVGLDWPLAVLTVPMILMMLVGVGRISAETGLFFIQPRWQPLGIFLGLLGAYALGPKAIIVVGLICVVLCLDPSESLMPYFVNGLRLSADRGVGPGRLGWATVTTYALGVALAVVVVLWANYDKGVRREMWATDRVPTMAYNPAEQAVIKLKLADELDESTSLSPLKRLISARPDSRFLWFAGAGFALVLVVSWMRLRFSWWPLHPVIFLVWATWPMNYFIHSFLLGWCIKTGITRVGGHSVYRKLRPLMIGVIAGDILGGLVFMVVGAVYYFLTNIPPIAYQIFPE